MNHTNDTVVDRGIHRITVSGGSRQSGIEEFIVEQYIGESWNSSWNSTLVNRGIHRGTVNRGKKSWSKINRVIDG